jgi:ubiquinone/menaquinone biosynthesis C-methylase UbiE
MNNDRRFSGEISRLRSPERVARLDVERVVGLSLAGINAESVLDVGTGSGLFAEAFASKGLRVAGVDLREDMLEEARRFVPSGTFRQAHMQTLPFADGEFSLVFLGHVLHEADDLKQALAEACRVAKRRVAVLEWPYAAQEFGPPLEHRLKGESIVAAAKEVGFKLVVEQALTHIHFYALDKPAQPADTSAIT